MKIQVNIFFIVFKNKKENNKRHEMNNSQKVRAKNALMLPEIYLFYVYCTEYIFISFVKTK